MLPNVFRCARCYSLGKVHLAVGNWQLALCCSLICAGTSGTETGEEDLKLVRCSSPCSVFDLADCLNTLLSTTSWQVLFLSANCYRLSASKGPASTVTRQRLRPLGANTRDPAR
jgi:hypothetical protein